jgi:hypothetical protein
LLTRSAESVNLESTKPHDLLSLQRVLDANDIDRELVEECAAPVCIDETATTSGACLYAEDPVLVCDAHGIIVDAHRCGIGGPVNGLRDVVGKPMASVFGARTYDRIKHALESRSRVTMTAYLFDDRGLLLRTEMCCWELRAGVERVDGGIAAMLHDALAMEEFEHRLHARITRLLERHLALEGALAAYRASEPRP